MNVLVLVFLSLLSFAKEQPVIYFIKAEAPKGLSKQELKACNEVDDLFSNGSLRGDKAVGILQGIKKGAQLKVMKCGYVPSLGQQELKSKYPVLFSVIRCSYGCQGDKFSFPDTRGRFDKK